MKKIITVITLIATGVAFASGERNNERHGQIPQDCACVQCFINTGSCNGNKFNDQRTAGKNVNNQKAAPAARPASGVSQ
jgi:hypothetical protein